MERIRVVPFHTATLRDGDGPPPTIITGGCGCGKTTQVPPPPAWSSLPHEIKVKKLPQVDPAPELK